jgi:hypothetical protein
MNGRTSQLLRRVASTMQANGPKGQSDPLPALKKRWHATPRSERYRTRIALIRQLVAIEEAQHG